MEFCGRSVKKKIFRFQRTLLCILKAVDSRLFRIDSIETQKKTIQRIPLNTQRNYRNYSWDKCDDLGLDFQKNISNIFPSGEFFEGAHNNIQCMLSIV